jgi:ubiquinone/menaquinone biosynthesis C-methylase UbiE
MIEKTRSKLDALGPKAKRATLLVADIADMPAIASDTFELILAMGDPLSICADPARAAREMHRISKPGGIVIATADNKLAAIDYFFDQSDIDGLEQLLRTGKTRWLTADQREQFELTTFTPAELRKLFERAGFEVIEITGKTILPIRKFKQLLADPATAEKLMKLEQMMSRDESASARAGHLQIIARKTMDNG